MIVFSDTYEASKVGMQTKDSFQVSNEEEDNIQKILQANKNNPDAIQFKKMDNRLSVVEEEEVEESTMIIPAGVRKQTVKQNQQN